MIKCPHCGNENASLIETRNHRREQMDCHCQVCAKSWVEKFKNIPKEDLLPTTQHPDVTKKQVEPVIKEVYEKYDGQS